MTDKTQNFIEKSILIHGNHYDYSKVEYEKSSVKVLITCKSHGGKFVFIRFNPDQFTNSLDTKKNPYMKRRMEYLEKEIYNQINRIDNEENKDLLEISYLFYDNFEYNL